MQSPIAGPFAATKPGDTIEFEYTNYNNVVSQRRVLVDTVRYGTTKYYPEPGWLIGGKDLDKGMSREFAVARMREKISCQSE